MNSLSIDVLLDAVFFSILSSAAAALHRVRSGRIAKKKPTKRRFWVHPTNVDRRKSSQYYTLFDDYYRHHEDKFFAYVRMSTASFDKLFALLECGLTKQISVREPICAKERLVVTLYFLAHGMSSLLVQFCTVRTLTFIGVSLAVLAHSFRMGKSTLSIIVSETCELIWNVLHPIVIKTPTTADEWRAVADRYWEKWQFPNCIGALDGKHCPIQAAPNTGSLDFNFHQFFSVNLTALCDADYKILYVDVGSYGHNNDAAVFESSTMGINFTNNLYDLPSPAPLPGTNIRVPYAVVADDIYPLKPYLMKPFPGRGLTKQQRIFNGRLSRARRCIENTFGIMTNTWRRLRTDVIASRENACRYFRAICCMHNFCRMEVDHRQHANAETFDDDGELIIGGLGKLQPMSDQRKNTKDNHPSHSTSHQRQLLCDFVNGVGAVPWQEQSYAKNMWSIGVHLLMMFLVDIVRNITMVTSSADD